MALKPEPMQRALIVGAKSQQANVIEALHTLRTAHFIDFVEQKDGEFSEFRLGAPLAHGALASERLVRIRALVRHLGLEGTRADKTFSPRDVDARLESGLDAVEADVNRAVEAREGVRNSLAEGKEMETKLEPLSTLPLRLEDYSGYDTLTVFVGRADEGFRAELPRIAPEHQLVTGEGSLFALFVPNEKANEVSDLLFRHGYAEVEVPSGAGAPAELIRDIQAQRATLDSRLQKAEQDLARLAGEHKDFLLAAEEHLTIAVEKAEAPLAFASTENAFIVDTWIPLASVATVEGAVTRATNGAVHFQRLETSDELAHGHGHGHGHDDTHGGADAAYNAHPAAPAPELVPPTKFNNPKATAGFSWFVQLFSTPRFNEIDPTTIFAIFFPLFFGFMIGDLGLGLLMVGLGALMMAKLKRVEGMRELGFAIVLAGVVASIFGGLVFKDAFGIPLGNTHHLEEHAIEQAAAQGVTITPAGLSCHDLYAYAHEPTWGCLLGGNSHFFAEPLIAKVTDLPTMLLLPVLAAVVHLGLGLLFGLRNEWGHGAKHVAAKFGYLILLLTFLPAVAALLRPDMFAGGPELEAHPAISAHLPITQVQAYLIAAVGFVVGGVILGWAEGFGGVLEIPSMFSAIMSYLRLGAVAIAKGAMAVAFNAMTLVAALEGLDAGNWLLFILGTIGFLIAQVVLFALGLLSGGIQALRLNFVEFFTKFYKGGGTPFKPFGRERVYTAPNTGATAAAASTVMITGLDQP